MSKVVEILRRFKCRRVMRSDGVLLEQQYVLHLNNDEPRYFVAKTDLIEFLNRYSNTNKIFSLHMFRVDCYSLM